MSDADDMAARSRQLAKDLLDALDAPDDPAVLAHLEQKEREDVAALEAFYIRTGQKPKPKYARTTAEMEFAAQLEPCAKCGARAIGKTALSSADKRTWALTGPCAKCGANRSFSFVTEHAPPEVEHARHELGPGPSQIIGPSAFRLELSRVVPLIDAEPTKLAPAAWHASLAAIRRSLIALNELAKLESGPERGKLEAARDRLLEVAGQYTADADRIRDLERRGS
jgi:hypothetical protein